VIAAGGRSHQRSGREDKEVLASEGSAIALGEGAVLRITAPSAGIVAQAGELVEPIGKEKPSSLFRSVAHMGVI